MVKKMKMIKGLLILFGLIVVLIALSYSKPAQLLIWNVKEFLNPQLEKQIEQQWQTQPNEFLLNVVKKNRYFISAIAARVLINRKDEKLVPDYIAILESDIPRFRAMAIKALGEIGDERAIQPLLKIVNKGQDDEYYLISLQALAKMKYGPIIPEIMRLFNRGSKKDERFANYAIDMLANFSTPEVIGFLQKVKSEGASYTLRVQAEEALKMLGFPSSREK